MLFREKHTLSSKLFGFVLILCLPLFTEAFPVNGLHSDEKSLETAKSLLKRALIKEINRELRDTSSLNDATRKSKGTNQHEVNSFENYLDDLIKDFQKKHKDTTQQSADANEKGTVLKPKNAPLYIPGKSNLKAKLTEGDADSNAAILREINKIDQAAIEKILHPGRIPKSRESEDKNVLSDEEMELLNFGLPSRLQRSGSQDESRFTTQSRSNPGLRLDEILLDTASPRHDPHKNNRFLRAKDYNGGSKFLISHMLKDPLPGPVLAKEAGLMYHPDQGIYADEGNSDWSRDYQGPIVSRSQLRELYQIFRQNALHGFNRRDSPALPLDEPLKDTDDLRELMTRQSALPLDEPLKVHREKSYDAQRRAASKDYEDEELNYLAKMLAEEMQDAPRRKLPSLRELLELNDGAVEISHGGKKLLGDAENDDYRSLMLSEDEEPVVNAKGNGKQSRRDSEGKNEHGLGKITSDARLSKLNAAKQHNSDVTVQSNLFDDKQGHKHDGKKGLLKGPNRKLVERSSEKRETGIIDEIENRVAQLQREIEAARRSKNAPKSKDILKM